MRRSSSRPGPLVCRTAHETASLLEESLLYLSDVPCHLPLVRPGHRVHLSTIIRWKDRGVQGVRLEAVRLGGRWVTSREALARFVSGVTGASKSGEPRDPNARQTPALITGSLDAEGL
jgi:Protein of unknown function (DUF1580)